MFLNEALLRNQYLWAKAFEKHRQRAYFFPTTELKLMKNCITHLNARSWFRNFVFVFSFKVTTAWRVSVLRSWGEKRGSINVIKFRCRNIKGYCIRVKQAILPTLDIPITTRRQQNAECFSFTVRHLLFSSLFKDRANSFTVGSILNLVPHSYFLQNIGAICTWKILSSYTSLKKWEK